MKTATSKIIFIYLLICLIWGSTWLGIRIGLESLPPLISSGFRFLIAAIGIWIFMKVRRIELQKDKLAIKLYLLMGVFSFIISYGLVYWAEQYVPSGLASVLFGIYPFFVALFSFFFLPDEKIGSYKIIGMVLGFIGIVVIFSESFGSELSFNVIGMIAVLLSGIIQAAIAVIIKKEGKPLNPLSMNFIPMLIAGIGLTILGFLFEDSTKINLDAKAIISVLYLAIFGSIVTFTGFYWLMKKVNVIILSLIAFITPIVALFLGWLVYNETLTQENIIGSVLVLIGLLVANLQTLIKSKSSIKVVE
jgi:drug/metabolite transporter (DMT)-like permease